VAIVTACVKHHRLLLFGTERFIIAGGNCLVCDTGHLLMLTTDMAVMGIWDTRGNYLHCLLDIIRELAITDNKNESPSMTTIRKAVSEVIPLVPYELILNKHKLAEYLSQDPTIQDARG
jgi:hypothetical protein